MQPRAGPQNHPGQRDSWGPACHRIPFAPRSPIAAAPDGGDTGPLTARPRRRRPVSPSGVGDHRLRSWAEPRCRATCRGLSSGGVGAGSCARYRLTCLGKGNRTWCSGPLIHGRGLWQERASLRRGCDVSGGLLDRLLGARPWWGPVRREGAGGHLTGRLGPCLTPSERRDHAPGWVGVTKNTRRRPSRFPHPRDNAERAVTG
jgi:hypothetical protein